MVTRPAGKGCWGGVAQIVSARRNNSNTIAHPDVEGWWKQVLAGDVSARHPVHGDDLKVKLTDGRLVLSGEVPSKRDRDRLLQEARKRIGSGVHEYDAKGLKIRSKDERAGVLSQTIVAAYSHRDTAEVALRFFLEHSRTKPMRTAVLQRKDKLESQLPVELVDDARKQLEHGQFLVAVEVDETDAFGARALLEEDTQSTWTIAAPPHALTERT